MQEREPENENPQDNNPQNDSVSETRNSWVRKKSADTVSAFTRQIHNIAPWLTADEITLLGIGLVALGSTIAASRDPKQQKKGEHIAVSGLLIGGSAMDLVDGSFARLFGKSKIGKYLDPASDRIEEILMNYSQAIYAHKQGRTLGEILAFLAAVTTTLPSMMRALSEWRGKVVPEAGKGIAGKLGTRLGRGSLEIIATDIPQTQEAVDAIVVTSSTKTAFDRFMVVINNEEPTLPQPTRDEAKKRFIMLTGIELGAIGVTLGIHYFLNKGTQSTANHT